MEDNNKKPAQQQRLENLDKILDDYESKTGLPKFNDNLENEDVAQYLSMSRGQIEKLDIETCAEAALMLAGYAFHLQRAYNRENARANWAESLLKEIVFGKENQFQGSWESKFYQAATSDDYARGILKIKNYAQSRAERIHFLASSIKNTTDLLVNLQRAKVMNK